MKPSRVLLVSLWCLLPVGLLAQEAPSDFRVTEVNARIADYPNRLDLRDPLTAYVGFQYLKAEGNASRYRTAASYRTRAFFPPPDAPAEIVKPDRRQEILATRIRAVISYRDRVAGVLTPFQGSLFVITYFVKEGDEWRHAGEDLGNDFADACAVFRSKAETFAGFIDRSRQLQAVSADSRFLASYLRKRGRAPHSLILDALATHRVVVYGEVHRRKASWDLLRQVVADPAFSSQVGTIFLELSSDAQETLDAFLAAPERDPKRLWSVFQNVQIDGWYDRGMYEFLDDLWTLERRLAPDRRIRVVAVDEPRPFATFRTGEDVQRHFRNALDRNTQMAGTIARTLAATTDTRNALFIVGVGHAFKSRVPGFAVGRAEPAPSAAAQLADRLGPRQVFTIFQHTPIISNNGTVHGLIRHGVLDAAFAELGDRPIAFAVPESPIAREPFDGLFEVSYAKGVGDFATNYDAYVFLGPLRSERAEYLFADFVTDSFVEELKRRADMSGASVERWFRVPSATREAIVGSIEKRTTAAVRWPRLQ